ncbi:MAG: pilin [Woeseiaceae bacterium]
MWTDRMPGLAGSIMPALALAASLAAGSAAAEQEALPAAWLHERLPADALAYQRLPNPLGFFAAPKGNALDAALSSPANVENLRRIRDGLVDNVIALLPELNEPRVRFLAGRLESPLEMAVFAAPAPSLLLAMSLDVPSSAGFEAAFAELARGEAPIALAAALDGDGFAEIAGLPAPAFLRFDEASRRLLLQVGAAVTQESFRALLAGLVPGANERIGPMERRLDESGQGWFVWSDAEKPLPVAQMFMPPEDLARLQATGLDKVRAAALGWGVADGKGRLGLVLAMAPDSKRQFLPFVANELSVKSVGTPDAVAILSLPSAAELARIESLILDAMDEDDRQQWLDFKERMRKETGVGLEDVFTALGPELIGVFDSVGDYAAIRLRDRPTFDRLVAALASAGGTEPDTHRAHGKTFYHWSMPGELAEVEADDPQDLTPGMEILLRQRDHLYWVEDGDYLLIASVPQPLMDRLARGADTSIADWLRERQRMDVSTSLLALTGTTRKLPLRLYYVYIELLQMLADLSAAEIDVWDMPTAGELALSGAGTLGLSLNLGDPYVSLEMTFENSPADVLFSGGAGSIVAAGIVAAIAIPAYQDYTVRAQVSEGFNLARPVQDAVAEDYAADGQFPSPSAAAALGAGIAGEHTRSVVVMPGSGIVVVTYFEDVAPEGGQLFLEPRVEAGLVVDWLCSGTLEARHMPAACRDNEVPEEVFGGA